MTGDKLHDGAERGPGDRDGARRTKLKLSTCTWGVVALLIYTDIFVPQI